MGSGPRIVRSTAIPSPSTHRRAGSRGGARPRARGLAVSLLAVAFAAGCGKSGAVLVPNEPPTLTLTSGPIDTSATNPVSWSVAITWQARDPDGTVDHVSYAVDPPSAPEAAAGQDTVWVGTKENGVVARFRAATPDPIGGPGTAKDFHVFVARAWDNSGAASERVVRAFYATTVAPSARIDKPAPAITRLTPVPRSMVIRFSGDDPDGIGTRAPVGFRVRLVSDQNPLFRALDSDPDSLRREALANNWRGWSTLPGDQTSFELTDLPEDTQWVFAVAAEDAAGAITPLFSYESNLVRLLISDASGPRLRMLGPGLDYTYAIGGTSADSSRWLSVTLPAGNRTSFSWLALPAPSRAITGYRWVLDPDTLSSETPRSNEVSDTRHWSAWSDHTLSTGELAPMSAGDHMLYVQTEDDFGARSLGIVRIRVFAVSFDRQLLVVDDTRFELDRRAAGGCVAPYTKQWPSAAELDTFLYAVGGVPWQCTVNPPGAPSPPGLFAGYGADTVGTRQIGPNPTATLPLSLLARYRSVIWLTDQDGALAPGTLSSPFSLLRWISRAGNVRAIEDYSRLGGRVWFAGGGTALATLVEGDLRANNTASNTVFTGPDLDLSTPVVALAHLRWQINVSRTIPALVRSPAARGGWVAQGPDGALAAPDYSGLPASLTVRSAATDPIPATRLASQANQFYGGSLGVEYAIGSVVTEDFGGIGGTRIESALDTLLDVVGATIEPSPSPVMLYYHGRENGPVLFSGFDLWSWSRTEAQALVDFVLRDVWGLTRSGSAAARVPATATAGPKRAASKRGLDPAARRP